MQSLKRIAVFLLAFIMALQVIISPSYAAWEVSGGGNGSSGVGGDGTYLDDMQGLRITPNRWYRKRKETTLYHLCKAQVVIFLCLFLDIDCMRKRKFLF